VAIKALKLNEIRIIPISTNPETFYISSSLGLLEVCENRVIIIIEIKTVISLIK
jgi:hypothetical protein